MVIQLLQPLWLWGLLGLLLPLAIHLLHKRSQRVVMVGSLQNFVGGAPVQARNIRLNEIWLLLLRCLLLALFVLLLAQPVLVQQQEEKKRLFIAPELVGQVNQDSLQAAGFALHWLQPGLPALEEPMRPDTTHYSYWEVFKEIENLAHTGDTVWLQFYPTLDRFWGKRPSLSKAFRLLPVPARPESKQLAHALPISDEQLLIQWWEPRQTGWPLRSDTVALADTANNQALPRIVAADITLIDTLRVWLQVEEEKSEEGRRWLMALQLIDSLQPHMAVIATQTDLDEPQIPAGTDVWIWLSAAAPPATFREQPEMLSLYQRLGRGDQWFLPDARDPNLYAVQHSLLAEDNRREQLAAFIPQLQQLLFAGNSEQAIPPVPLAAGQWQVQKSSVKKEAVEESTSALDAWLWGILLLTFMVERWLSLRK